MLNLRFLRDSYVTWERRRLQITKFQAFGGLLGTFWGHFGTFWGPFRHILGFRSALGSIYVIKGGEQLTHSPLWDRKMSQIDDFWFPKSSKIEAKMTPKKEKK